MYLTIWAKCPFTSHSVTGSCGKRARKKTEPGTWNLVPKLSDPRNYEVTEALRISFGEGKRDASTFGMCPEGILSIERPPAFPVP